MLRATLRVARTVLLTAAVCAPGSAAAHDQPQPRIAEMDYTPVGAFVPGSPIPSPLEPPTDPNPSAKWVAYDTNVYETLNFPGRHPGDETDDDPPGSGDPRHGFCPPEDPQFLPWGRCANHQREYLDHFEWAMRDILGDFGVVVHRYPFTSPGSDEPRGAPLAAAGGQAWNISATVPGADHPDESVLVSGHYDFTDSGPAAAWDSAEGHATVIRIASIMADYWRATGTRPATTIKFIPWDSEESGTIGSAHYVENNIPPGEEHKVRAYFNMDPCAGAYPAFKRGNPAERVPEVLQLADPANWDEQPAVRERIERFNARAETVVDEVFDHLDDTITVAGSQQPIFVSDREADEQSVDSQRDQIVTAVGGLALFTSDYRNFESVGIPIFNLFPDYFGPHADGTPASADGITILHTPRDNLTTINALTSADPTGMTVSEGWAKGMEMCAHLEGWYLLQPEMGGAHTATEEVVAYYEALPNEAIVGQAVRFDATGSHQYADPLTRELVDDSRLNYRWDFGDGSMGTGRVATHRYGTVGRYPTTLTVTDTATGATDRMTLPVVVIPSDLAPPLLHPLPEQDEDGAFTLEWSFDGPEDGLERFVVERSTDLATLLADDAEGDLTARWEASAVDGVQLHPWQPSNGSPALYGNKRHGGASGYWTGVNPPAPSPANVASTLTLKEPVTVPRHGDPLLEFWSYFESESDDAGIVEVAQVTGGQAGEWQPLLRETGTILDEGKGPDAPLVHRRVSLAGFKGQQVRLRFRYQLGPSDPAVSQPVGWYLDDLRLSSGTWDAVGDAGPAQHAFEMTGLKAGRYAFRVKAAYADGVASAPSNVEAITVTAPGGGGGTDTTTGGAGDGAPGGRGEGSPAPTPVTGGGAGLVALAVLGVAFWARRRP
ncbi:MAG TPA: M28 family peptidase [Nitriliruptorales bacterium]|nr:M28 family peptidase [Nitriliruptorales bacterium]